AYMYDGLFPAGLDPRQLLRERRHDEVRALSGADVIERTRNNDGNSVRAPGSACKTACGRLARAVWIDGFYGMVLVQGVLRFGDSAVNRCRPGEDKARKGFTGSSARANRFQQTSRSHRVNFVGLQRLLDRARHERLAGQMENRIRIGHIE